MKTLLILSVCLASSIGMPAWAALMSPGDAAHLMLTRPDGSRIARNPGQGWTTTFDQSGFVTTPDHGNWSWGLSLDAGQWPVTGAAVTEGNKLSVQRGEVMEEWFVNDTRGLEQGWTIHRAPPGLGHELQLDLQVRGGLQPEADTQNIRFVDRSGTTMLTYGGLKAWDATGRTLDCSFSACDNQISIHVDIRNAVYPVTVDPLAQNAYLKPNVVGAGDEFGISLAVSGDTMVVGALGEDGNGSSQSDNSAGGSGAVYVFTRIGNSWSQQAYLKASNIGANDSFGISVAISGNTIVVGAEDEASNATGVNGDQADNSAASSGAAYVYVRNGVVWTQQAYLKASNTEAGDNFGAKVAISGDTIVVGARNEDSGTAGVNGADNNNTALDSGAAYVFVRNGTDWAQQAYLKASNTDAGDTFGSAVAIDGNSIVVAAEQERSASTGVNGNQADDSTSQAGAAYMFVRTGTVWKQQAYLKASNTGGADFFGGAVAISGNTALISGYLEDSNATGVNGNQSDNSAFESGAVYVFLRTGSTWKQQAYLKASNTGAGDQFGRYLALHGDTALIAAAGEASNATGINGDQTNNTLSSAGAAYLFQRSGTQWSQRAYIKASNPNSGDQFGFDLAVSDRYMLIGARSEDSASTTQTDNSASNAGAVYAFDLTHTLTTHAQGGQRAFQTPDIFYGSMGATAVNQVGSIAFDTALTGAGAPAAKNRGLFFSFPFQSMILQKGDPVGGFLGLPAAATITGFSALTFNNISNAWFLATVAGPGITSTSNRLLLADNGNAAAAVLRSGLALAPLGGASISAIPDFVVHRAFGSAAVSYTLKQSSTLGVNSANDSGLIFVDAGPAVLGTAAREGQSAFGGGGTFGQFRGHASYHRNPQSFFITKFLPAGGGSKDALFFTDNFNMVTGRFTPVQGDPAPGTVSGEKFGTFLATSDLGAAAGVLRATLTGATSLNEGLWRTSDSALLMRKGDSIGSGLSIARIIRWWSVLADQIVAHVQLGGAVTSSNNQALVLRQANGAYLILARTGTAAKDLGNPAITLSSFSAIEVDPGTGTYAILGSLKGVASSGNQALWAGSTGLGDDTMLQALRLPKLQLRKGERYVPSPFPPTSGILPVCTIKGLTLKTVLDANGSEGRGEGQALHTNVLAVVITADIGRQDLVTLFVP